MSCYGIMRHTPAKCAHGYHNFDRPASALAQEDAFIDRMLENS